VKEKNTNIKHAFTSILSLAVMFLLVYFSFTWINNNISNNSGLIWGVEIDVANEYAVRVLCIAISVLISYIIYLLLSSKTRATLVAEEMTKSIYVSLEQLNSIYEESPVPYMTINKKGIVVDPNKATLRFFGVTPKEIEGVNLFSLTAKEDKEKAEKLFLYYQSNVPINMEEIRMTTRNGKTRWVLLSIFKMDESAKKDKPGLATIFDITERKELDKAKTEFVSLASHQLRTPAATIKWYVDSIMAGNLGDITQKQRDYLERVQKVNENMIELVETLLNISRIEIGSINIEKKEVSVPQIIDSVLLELSTAIETKKLNVLREYNGSLEHIEADPKLLRIVVQNIISNAVKYTKPMGIIKIGLKDSFGEKAVVVSDTGIGIPEEDRDKIFTKLFRASNAQIESESQGTGLGLYLVKSVVEAMGGSIDFVSEVGKGSTFTVRI